MRGRPVIGQQGVDYRDQIDLLKRKNNLGSGLSNYRQERATPTVLDQEERNKMKENLRLLKRRPDNAQVRLPAMPPLPL